MQALFNAAPREKPSKDCFQGFKFLAAEISQLLEKREKLLVLDVESDLKAFLAPRCDLLDRDLQRLGQLFKGFPSRLRALCFPSSDMTL